MKSRFAHACVLMFCFAATAASAQSPQPAPPKAPPPARAPQSELPPPLHQQIIANLLFQYPQLASASPTVQSLEPEGADGLRLGMLGFDKGRTQQFMVSERGTLYLLQGKPIALLDEGQLEAAKLTREKEQAKEDTDRHAQLQKAIAGQPSRGNAKAKVTLVEFSDYQCPYCARASKAVDEMLAANGKDVRYVVLPFPLDSIHPWARNAAVAAQCAQQQKAEAFWTLNDAFYAQQAAFNKDNTLAKSRELLANAKIDLKRWDACVGDPNSKDYASALAAVDAGVAIGRAVGVNATPSFFVNGRKFAGVPSAQALADLLGKPAAPAAPAAAPK